MRDDRTAVIPGRYTEGGSATVLLKNTLFQAARITVDHGFRYFEIVGSRYQASGENRKAGALDKNNSWNDSRFPFIQPGADVTIKVFRTGEIDSRIAGIWDAQQILTSGVSDVPAGSGPTTAIQQLYQSSNPTRQTPLRPRCTAYGCDW
jgi:hypothetical protein